MIADGPPSRILEEAIDRRIELIVPVPVLDELERVLTHKLGFSSDSATVARQLVERIATARPDQPAHVDHVTSDEADDIVLACAVESGADVLVTGDRKHLLPLREHRGVRLLTPQALLAELRAR